MSPRLSHVPSAHPLVSVQLLYVLPASPFVCPSVYPALTCPLSATLVVPLSVSIALTCPLCVPTALTYLLKVPLSVPLGVFKALRCPPQHPLGVPLSVPSSHMSHLCSHGPHMSLHCPLQCHPRFLHSSHMSPQCTQLSMALHVPTALTCPPSVPGLTVVPLCQPIVKTSFQ